MKLISNLSCKIFYSLLSAKSWETGIDSGYVIVKKCHFELKMQELAMLKYFTV